MATGNNNKGILLFKQKVFCSYDQLVMVNSRYFSYLKFKALIGFVRSTQLVKVELKFIIKQPNIPCVIFNSVKSFQISSLKLGMQLMDLLLSGFSFI